MDLWKAGEKKTKEMNIMQKRGENKVADREAGAGERLGPHSTADRERARMSKLAIEQAGHAHSACMSIFSEKHHQQCNALCLYVRYTIDRVGHTHHHHCKLAKKSSASPTSNHDRTGIALVCTCTHGRILHRLGFGLLARCCLPAWDASGIMASFSCFPGTCCSPQPRHTILSLLFSSIFPSSHGVKASKLQGALTHEWPRVGRLIKCKNLRDTM